MLLATLIQEGRIRLEASPWLSHIPAEIPAGAREARVRGMVLGLAIGDALGAPTESMLPSQRRQVFGEVRDYLPSRYNGERRGFPTDDSQLALWTLDQLNQDHGLEPESLLRRFASRKIFGIGATVRGSAPALRRRYELAAMWSGIRW